MSKFMGQYNNLNSIKIRTVEDTSALIKSVGTSSLPELPEGWEWVSLGEVFRIEIGATPSRKESDYWKGEIPWVSSSEVAFCRIKSTREKISQKGLENSSTKVLPVGTVLLAMVGEGKTRGQVAILDIDACNNQNSAAIVVSETPLPSEYLYRYLEGEYQRTRNIGAGNNQPALNKNKVQSMVFPVAPLQEQLQIVKKLESLLSIVEKLERFIIENQEKLQTLDQSILAKAFRGELVPQDLNDEPASVLLERIKAERAANEEATKNKKIKPKQTTKQEKQPQIETVIKVEIEEEQISVPSKEDEDGGREMVQLSLFE